MAERVRVPLYPHTSEHSDHGPHSVTLQFLEHTPSACFEHPVRKDGDLHVIQASHVLVTSAAPSIVWLLKYPDGQSSHCLVAVL